MASVMGSCNLGDLIAGDHINVDMTTCNIQDSQQKYRLGTITNGLLEWSGA